MKQNLMDLPEIIADRYELYRLEDLWGQSQAKKGFYIDNKTKSLVFIKIDTNKELILREYAYQKLFFDRSKKINTKSVIIPKPLEVIESDGYVALVMEYFHGESILKKDVKARLDIYIRTLKFLEEVNAVGGGNVKHNFVRKTAIHQLVTIPYFLSKNLMFYLPYTVLFINSFRLITNVALKWRKLTSNWLCHGDINVTNILLSGNKIIICDFACACMSHRYFDISRTLNSTWYQKEFHEKFWERIISEFNFAKPQQNILRSFVVFNLLQRLSQHYSNLNQERFYLKRLERVLATL